MKPLLVLFSRRKGRHWVEVRFSNDAASPGEIYDHEVGAGKLRGRVHEDADDGDEVRLGGVAVEEPVLGRDWAWS